MGCFRKLTGLCVVVTILLLGSGCQLLRKKSAAAEDELVASGTAEAGLVVQQTGSRQVIMSPGDRSYWLGIRKDGASPTLTKIDAAMALGEWKVAEAESRQYLERHPASPDGFRRLATALALGKKYHLAAYYAGLLEKQQPNDPDTLNLKALAIITDVKNNIEDFRQAASILHEAFYNSSNHVASGLNLGHLYLNLGNSKAAADVYASLIKRCSGCEQAYMGYAVAKSRNGEYDVAKQSFEKVLKSQKYRYEALYHLAILYKRGYDDNKRAKECLDDLLADVPQDQVNLRKRANSVLRQVNAEMERSAVAKQNPQSDGGEDNAAPNAIWTKSMPDE